MITLGNMSTEHGSKLFGIVLECRVTPVPGLQRSELDAGFWVSYVTSHRARLSFPPHSAFFSPTQNAAPKGAAFDPVAKQKLDQLDAPD